jgi:hypothetical protein
MSVPNKPVISLYVDRLSGQWVVRDACGDFWILPPGDSPWELRQPFQMTTESRLDPVPGHYRSALGIPH